MMKDNRGTRRFQVSRAMVLLLAVLAAFFLLQGGGISSAASGSGESPNAGAVSPDTNCPANGQCFADVLPNNVFFNFVNRIYQQDLVTGYPCGGPGEPCDAESRPYYRPNSNVTRQQMAKFIDNARRLPGIYIQTSSAVPPITANATAPNSTAIYGIGGYVGVEGISETGEGIYGQSTDGEGVYGDSSSSYGVEGESFNNEGVHGHSVNGTGVYGSSQQGYAGFFQGDVVVTGFCCQSSAGSYRIDDPTDPANKYLYQSAVESSEMLGIYRGHVTLDANGDAYVDLPSWFQSLYADFDYQLTCVGGYAPVFVAQEIENNRFEIAGGKPDLKVSWQVTGVRHDAYAQQHPVPTQQDKPAGEQGTYLHPELYGQPGK